MDTGGKPSGPPDTRLRLREQILNDQKLLTVGRGVNKMKPYTFGSLLPNSLEQAERLSSRKRQRSGENLKVTDLLENIRTKGNRVRMDFITQRMGILRGEAPTSADTSSLLNIIKNNIRANSSRSETEKPSLVTNLSNLLDFPGRQTFKNFQQKEEAAKNLMKGMRFINKLDDNEMLKLIKADEKGLGITIEKKPNERIWKSTNITVPQPPQTTFEINGLN